MDGVSNIDLFFTNPRIEAKPPGTFGILYLLRRDVQHCIEGNHTLWLGAMGILAGIDLLAKFLTGNDQSRQVGERFCNFVKKYFQPISDDDAETIYQLRNSLLHSFGLYSEKRKGKTCQRYYFTFVAAPINMPLVIPHPDLQDRYLINLMTLHERFETAIQRYQAEIEDNVDLQKHFAAMFPKYGAIDVGPMRVH